MWVLGLSLLLAGVLGFSAHRASVCTVKGVAEVLTSGSTHMFTSFAKSALWVQAVTLPMMLLMPETAIELDGWVVTLPGVFGGLMFGLGAVLNKGCSLSTLTRLADGQMRMIVTLIAFCAGIAGARWLDVGSPLATAAGLANAAATRGDWMYLGLAGLWLWAGYELVRLWRTRASGRSWSDALLSGSLRLSSAAVLIGVSSGVLYALHGSWAYTSTLVRSVDALLGAAPGIDASLWMLFVAALAGAVVSAGLRGSFRLEWRPSREWIPNAMGGTLMGFGAALVPGGNDAVLLHGIPNLSPHALPTYVSLVAGIAIALIAMRALSGMRMRVTCNGDICHAHI